MSTLKLTNVYALRKKCTDILNSQAHFFLPISVDSLGKIVTCEKEYLTHQLFSQEIMYANTVHYCGELRAQELLRTVEEQIQKMTTLRCVYNWLCLDDSRALDKECSGLVLKEPIGVLEFAKYSLGINRLESIKNISSLRRQVLTNHIDNSLERLSSQKDS